MKLEGITTEGKEQIKEHGDTWILIERWHEVGFSEQKGPWGYIRSISTGDKRWVHLEKDKYFRVVKRASSSVG